MINQQFSPRSTTARNARGESSGGYQYRGEAAAAQPHKPAAKDALVQELTNSTWCLTHASSRLRDATNQLNRYIGQAAQDGMSITMIVGITGLDTRQVRAAALAFEYLQPWGIKRAAHESTLKSLSDQLRKAAQEKTNLDGRRASLIIAALKSGLLDDFDAAALTGLRPEQIRKLTRGTGLRRPA